MTSNGGWAPHVVTPEGGGGVDALADLISDPGAVAGLLLRAGAIVYRGFEITVDELARVLSLLLPDRMAYVHGNSPRTKVGADLYTSTEYPREQVISMHSEMSYAARWPARLTFFCERGAATGGQTPLVATDQWLAAIDPEVRAAFTGGVRYVQNLHDGYGLGRSWQDTFETTDRDTVESFLDGTGADWSWRADGGLRVSQTRPATTVHPVTGTEVWFNQADQWHPSMLGDDTAAALAELLAPDGFPQLVTFADGQPIPAGHVAHVREQGLASAVDVEWAPGDVVLVENVLVAHGRRAFTGDRRVLVAMSD